MASYSKRVATISKTMKIAEISGMIQSESNVTNVEVRPSINHVICIDVSGSMWYVLPQIRTQLKSKLVDIVGDNDTVTLIKFDNRGSIISEMVQVSKANDVRELNKLIDKELRAGGCTNFYDPIKLTNELVTRMNKSKGLWDFFFMSDGGHNTGGTWSEVTAALSTLQSKISNATICEYGYWADSKRLTEMAEILGGQKIFDKDFDEYQVDFENVMKTGSTETVKRVEFDVTDFKPLMKLQLMYTVDKVHRVIKVYSTERTDVILIPEDTEKIYYIEKNQKEATSGLILSDEEINSAAYAAIYLMADRLKYNLAEELLHGTKDKELVEMYCNSFGKQKLELFKDAVVGRVYGDTTCLEYTTSDYKPNAKKYCVLDFVEDIMSHPMNLIHLTHPDFEYNLTTAKSVKSIELSDDDRDKLSKSSTKSKADRVLDEASKYQVKMTVSDPYAGYSVSNIVWNNERASLSVQVRIPVDLTVPTRDKIGTMSVKSFITRNYTIIKDGVLNMPKLLLTVDSQLRGKFKRMKLVENQYDNDIITVDISSLPIINKKRTETVYAMELASKEFELLRCRAINKYLGYLKKSLDASNKTAIVTEDDYLKSLGITSKGYSPKTELVKNGDFYMATILDSKIEKFSNLPKIEDVLKKRDNGKPFTVSESYMNRYMEFVDSILANASSYSEELNDLIDTYKKNQKKVMEEISKAKFILLVSRKWFADKSDFDDNSISTNVEGNDLKVSFVFGEKKIDL